MPAEKNSELGLNIMTAPTICGSIAPLGGIGRLSQLRQVSQTIEGFGPAHIAKGVAAHDIQRRIVDPGVRVADADGQARQAWPTLFSLSPADIQVRFEMRAR